MTTLTRKSRRSIDPHEVEHYITRGHWGYVLDYRQEHQGEDPDPEALDLLAEEAERRKFSPFTRALKGILRTVF